MEDLINVWVKYENFRTTTVEASPSTNVDTFIKKSKTDLQLEPSAIRLELYTWEGTESLPVADLLGKYLDGHSDTKPLRIRSIPLASSAEPVPDAKTPTLSFHMVERSVATVLEKSTISASIRSGFQATLFEADSTHPFATHIKQLQIPSIANQPNLLLHGLKDKQLTGAKNPELWKQNPEMGVKTMVIYNVSGAGKTRLVLEALTNEFGIYFTASKHLNFSSEDFSLAASHIDTLPDLSHVTEADRAKFAIENEDRASRHLYALLLSRLVGLEHYICHCILLGKRPDSFHWLLLQLHPLKYAGTGQATFSHDVFSELYKILIGVHSRELQDRIQQAWSQIQPWIQGCSNGGTCLKVFCDEAQFLLECGKRRFLSAHSSDLKPYITQVTRAFGNSFVWMQLIMTGTGFSLTKANAVLSSAVLKQGGVPALMDLGSFLDEERFMQYCEIYFPGAWNELKDAYLWLRGRHRFLATFIERLIVDFDPKQALTSIIHDLTAKNNIQSLYDILEKRKTAVIANVPGELDFFTILRELSFRAAYEGESSVIEDHTAIMVDTGFAMIQRKSQKGDVVEATFEEQIPILAAVAWFEDQLPGSFFRWIEGRMRADSTASGCGHIWELAVMESLNRLFNGIAAFKSLPGLQDTHQKPAWMDCSFVIGRRQLQQQMSITCRDKNDFMKWVLNPAQKFCRPDRLAGPDLAGILTSSDGMYSIPVFAQVKLRRQVTKAIALRSVTAEYLYLSANPTPTERAFNATLLQQLDSNYDLKSNGYVQVLVTFPAAVAPSIPQKPRVTRSGSHNVYQLIFSAEEISRIFPDSHVNFVEILKKSIF